MNANSTPPPRTAHLRAVVWLMVRIITIIQRGICPSLRVSEWANGVFLSQTDGNPLRWQEICWAGQMTKSPPLLALIILERLVCFLVNTTGGSLSFGRGGLVPVIGIESKDILNMRRSAEMLHPLC